MRIFLVSALAASCLLGSCCRSVPSNDYVIEVAYGTADSEMSLFPSMDMVVDKPIASQADFRRALVLFLNKNAELTRGYEWSSVREKDGMYYSASPELSPACIIYAFRGKTLVRYYTPR